MMRIHINHCWCSESNWGGNYNGRVMVSIERIGRGKTYYDLPTWDWTHCLTKYPLPGPFEFGDKRETIRLNPEIIEWLNINIKPRRFNPYNKHHHGWGIGSDKYASLNPLSYTIFFERIGDAKKFVKKWSSLGKPETYFNYFDNIRLQYNPLSRKLEKVERFSD